MQAGNSARTEHAKPVGNEPDAALLAHCASTPLSKKLKAQAMVHEALRKGVLVKLSECSICGRRRLLNGHHDNYDKPLVVRWVCGPCHSVIHGRTTHGRTCGRYVQKIPLEQRKSYSCRNPGGRLRTSWAEAIAARIAASAPLAEMPIDGRWRSGNRKHKPAPVPALTTTATPEVQP